MLILTKVKLLWNTLAVPSSQPITKRIANCNVSIEVGWRKTVKESQWQFVINIY